MKIGDTTSRMTAHGFRKIETTIEEFFPAYPAKKLNVETYRQPGGPLRTKAYTYERTAGGGMLVMPWDGDIHEILATSNARATQRNLQMQHDACIAALKADSSKLIKKLDERMEKCKAK